MSHIGLCVVYTIYHSPVPTLTLCQWQLLVYHTTKERCVFACMETRASEWHSSIQCVGALTSPTSEWLSFPLSISISIYFAAAAYTYYRTLCQERSLARRGKSQERKEKRRRRERISRVCLSTLLALCT